MVKYIRLICIGCIRNSFSQPKRLWLPKQHPHWLSSLHSPSLSYIHLPFLTFTFPFLHSPSLSHIHLPFLTLTFPFLHSPSLPYIHLPFLTFTFPFLHSPSLSYIHLVSLLRVSVYMRVCRQLPSTSRLIANYCLGTYWLSFCPRTELHTSSVINLRKTCRQIWQWYVIWWNMIARRCF